MSALLNLLGVSVYLRYTLLNGCSHDVTNVQDKNVVWKCGKEITEEKIGLFIVVVLLVRGVIFKWGNFTPCFFQSNDKWVYSFNRNIFILKSYILLFFYIKILFSLTTTYGIPFLEIHVTICFLSVSCYIINVNQWWITYVLFQTMLIGCRQFQNGLRYVNI